MQQENDQTNDTLAVVVNEKLDKLEQMISTLAEGMGSMQKQIKDL